MSLAFAVSAAALATPQYQIINMGRVSALDNAAQGFRVSNSGLATGRVLRPSAAQAFSWSQGGGIVGLTQPAGRNYAVGNGINDSGVVVGTGSTTAFGSNPLPFMWSGGTVTQLGLPSGQTVGRANDVNSSNVAVGSVNGGSLERAVVYQGSTGSLITATTSNGSFMTTAFSINDSGWVVGNGIDPTNAAVNVGLLYNLNTNTMTSVGALSGLNGALAFDVSNGGHVVGSSMLNQGSGTPFIWTQGGGMSAIPLPTGTSQGSARGVNASGWAVGTASSAFAIPFVFDGTNTYRMADVVVNAAGWDLSTNTSSSAMSISDNGIIVGTAVFNGQVSAYAAVPVPEPGTFAVVGLGVAALLRKRRKA